MGRGVIPGRPPELEEFMRELRALRERAGQPSFRRMARASGAVSHATLHLSVTGYRLQPWETVREFVRACAGDEAAWHAKWQQVDAALTGSEPEPEPERSGSRRRWLVVLAVLVVVAGGAGAVLAFTGEDDAQPPPSSPGKKADSSRFIADVSIPDGTVVKPGSKFDKIWEIQNSGDTLWSGRSLRRDDSVVGPQPCRTPETIPVEETKPGENVKVKVRVTAGEDAPATCKVHWKMVDGTGELTFPEARPIFFYVKIRD